jgi:hypothetical protein
MIESYLHLFVNYIIKNPKVEDVEAREFLITNGIPDVIATDIVTFLPIAFNRRYFSTTAVKFSDMYYVYQDGNCEILNFSDNAIFKEAIRFYDNHIANNISKDNLIKIAGRCSEFDTIIQVLEDKAEYKNLVIEPMRFYY